jgi:hypothetical protein
MQYILGYLHRISPHGEQGTSWKTKFSFSTYLPNSYIEFALPHKTTIFKEKYAFSRQGDMRLMFP